jgi:hypothetical protein
MMARLDESRLSEISGPAPIKRATPYDPRSGNTPDSISPKKAFIDPTFTEGMMAAGDAYAAAGDAAAAAGDAALNQGRDAGTGLGTFTATDGKVFTDELAFATYQASLNTSEAATASAASAAATAKATAEQEAKAAAEEKLRKGQSAFDFLKLQFSNLGIGDLIAPLEELIKEGISSDEMTLRLMNDPKYNKAYKTRFSANDARIAAGLRALSPAEYVGLEDKYQEVMRQAGLPESYYAKDATGKQIGFEKLIANDISNLELQDRIGTAQKRVLNANPEVTQALKQFYPDITNADILAYTLDPKNAIENIKRKVTSAEIGGAAIQSGLGTSLARAEELQRYGVDKAAATAGFATIGAGLQRGSELASIYQQDPYTQTTAESEIFNVPGAKEARKQRQKITGLEKATFGGQTGITSGALARDRAGGY